MSAVALAKPGTVDGAVFMVGSELGTAPTGDAQFVIKVDRAQVRFLTVVGEVTGDGDTSPCFTHNNLLYCLFRFNGFVVASKKIGVEYLVALNGGVDVNPFESLQLVMASGQPIDMTQAILSQIDVEWNRRANAIGLAMSGRATATLPTDFEANVGA